MRRILITLLLVLTGAGISQAQVFPIRGWCEAGAQPVVLAGLNSTTQVQASFPQCTVNVFIHGDGAATIFADANSTPLGNPFMAQTNGQWLFYAAPGRYDVQLSGGGLPSTITYSDINTTGSGGATPGGIPVQTQVNNAGVFGGSPCESFLTFATGPENVDCDWHSKGPNPSVDVTRYGARTCAPNLPPCSAGITATITSGTNTASISSASSFIKGDGVVIYGAGATASVTSAPTGVAVSSVLAAMGTGTGLTATGANGSTTRCYKVIARDRDGGYTSASSESCTTTGQATLGAVSVNLTSCTRSAASVSCTAASTTPLLVGGSKAEVFIGGTIADNSFRGWRPIDNAADSTHFTFTDGGDDTGGGATTTMVASAPTATFFVADHITWTAVANAWIYYIYEGASGAETLVGYSRPQGNISIPDPTFDYFGSTMMANFQFPPWIPTTPPASGANDNLSATITSGAGTTSLVLSTNAGASVAGAQIRLDAKPGFIAAAAAATTFGPMYIPNDPSGNFFVINSFCDLRPYLLSVIQSGNIYEFETIAIGNQGPRWSGHYNTNNAGASTGVWGGYPQILANYAQPGFYMATGGTQVDGVSFFPGSTQNGVLNVLGDWSGSFTWSFSNDVFASGTQANDLMGFGLILRGGNDVVMDLVSIGGGNSLAGNSHNAGFFCNGCGNAWIRQMFTSNRGIIWHFNNNGPGTIAVEDNHFLGGGVPGVASDGGTVVLGRPGKPVEMDTIGEPCASAFPVSAQVTVINYGCSPSGVSYSSPSITGPVSVATGSGIAGPGFFVNSLGSYLNSGKAFNTAIPYTTVTNRGPGGISVDSNNAGIFVQGVTPAAPTCVISAGGSVQINTWFFFVQPVWQNNLEGTVSPTSLGCVTTTGNQTITVNWTQVPGNPRGWNVFAALSGTGAGVVSSPIPLPGSQTSFVVSTPINVGSPVINPNSIAGPTELLPGSGGVRAPAFVLGGAGGFNSTSTAPSLTADRSVTWPDAAGNVVIDTATQTLTSKTLVTPVINGASTGTGVQGSDSKLITSGMVSGTGASLCTDANGGATTSGCPTISGLTSGQVAIAGSATTITSSKALQGTDANVLSSGTVSGTGTTLCTDANGGATTSGCLTSVAIQSQITTTLGADNTLTASTATSIITQAVTMPSSGCPCRAFLSYGAYHVTPASDTKTNFWVDDNNGTDGAGHVFATSQTATGTSPATTGGNSASAFTTGTYANNASVTFVLRAESNQGITVKAATFNSVGQNTWLQIVIQTSN